MMKYNCDIVRDLMPLCVDGTASEPSRQMVVDHVLECRDCMQMYQEMRTEVPKEPPVARDAAPFRSTVRRLRRKRNKRRTLLVLAGIILGLALVLGLVVELMRNVIVDAYAKNEKRVLKLSQIRTIISTLEKPDKRAKQLADLKTMFTKQLRTTYNSCPETEQQLRRTLNEAADRAFGIISLKYFAVESVLED